MPQFERYIGIDYSGAQTPVSSLPGLRVYAADRAMPPSEITPPVTPRKHWTRRGLAEWLVERLSGEEPILVGIDHAFSFPLCYFERHLLSPDWPSFLEDFCKHWPTDEDSTYVSFVRDGRCGQAAKRQGDASWFRLTERWTVSAKSVFQFDVQGQVATSTHAGLPWLRFIRKECDARVHFWPFDGWEIPAGRSAIAEVYPSLWMKRFPAEDRTGDQQAAFVVAAWMRQADLNGSLAGVLKPPLQSEEQTLAKVEGWILGVT